MFTKVLIGKKAYRIRYGNRALYRHGTLDKPLGLEEFRKPQKRLTVLAQWIWACLADEDMNAFASPDDLADSIEDGDLPNLISALTSVLAIANPNTAKNDDSSTSLPSPTSSSS